jgi:hypothetical protein
MNKPCPGCRSDDVHPLFSNHIGWRIMCWGCSMVGPSGDDEPDAWRRWNGLPRRRGEPGRGSLDDLAVRR